MRLLRTVAAVCVLIAGLSLPSCADRRAVATVDSSTIRFGEFREAAERRAGMLGVPELSAKEKRALLDSLVQREVVYLYAKKNGEEIPVERWNEVMRNLSFTARIFRKKEMKKRLLYELMLNRVRARTTLSETEIRRYFNEKRERYVEPARFKVHLVQVSPGDVKHVVEKLKSTPEAFDDMALRRSAPALRRINENAQFTSMEDFPEEMWPHLDQMKVGDISQPIQTKRGLFLFKLVDLIPPRVVPLSEVFLQIEHELKAEKDSLAFLRWYDEIKKGFSITIFEDRI